MKEYSTDEHSCFSEILFSEFDPVDAKLCFNEYLDENYKLPEYLSDFPFSYVFYKIDPVCYNTEFNNFVNDNFELFAGEWWDPRDFKLALDMCQIKKDEEDE